ncbi:hypothetical protein AVEN_46142-1 [Araneus ventricosus]|uniref:Uncharacterized protein n=1 Tax=Araneus ventricosus TaxID=182803 RepID=A0A4Y2D791_ARAVE|nr:hypothetical protein AVEN_46142-1 [Araneus ventricosus]
MSAADRRTAAPGGHERDVREKAITMQRNQYLSESAFGGFEEISGTLSCHTCIVPVVGKTQDPSPRSDLTTGNMEDSSSDMEEEQDEPWPSIAEAKTF